VSRLGLEIASTVPPLSALLSLTTDDQNSGTPEGALKRRQLLAISSVLEAISIEVPLLMVVEDVHWLVPSTLELLDAIGERLIHARVLIVMTHRPEFTFSTGSGARLTQIPLSHLGGQESIAIVTRVAGNKPLPDEVAEQIIAKTGGIPLFVEELTKSLLESGVLRDDGKRFVLDDPLPPLAIPPSLQDSLMARLDRLAATKDIAQLAACIGRNFGLQLLSAVASHDADALHSALDQLVEAGLIHERGMPPDITYEFKHALVRDAAYDSLLKSTRQLNHQRIAQTLEQDFKSLADAQPELVAQHYSEGGLAEPAVTWWQRAGEKSAKSDARLEAIRHLEIGLELLSTLDRSEARARSEADMLMVLGNAIRVTEGHASERAEELFTRSRSVCEWLHDKDREFPALWGWSVAMARGALAKATKQAENVLVLAQEIGKPDLVLEAHHTLWGTFSLTGDLVATRHHAERGFELYRFEQHGDDGFVYGNHDPGVCALYTNAFALWMLGYSEQARAQVEHAMELICRHTQSIFIAHGLLHCCMPYLLLGDSTAVRENLARVRPLAIETANQGQISECEFTLGCALAVDGEYANAIEQMEQGLATQPPAASRYYNCYYLSILADTCYRSGQFDKGQDYLRQAIEEANATGERWWEAELHRLEGHVHLLAAGGHLDNARECFQVALDVSRAQGAKILELRAAADLSRLLRDQGERQQAFDLLISVYEWFTEGFDAADLREAKVLIEELS